MVSFSHIVSVSRAGPSRSCLASWVTQLRKPLSLFLLSAPPFKTSNVLQSFRSDSSY
uniref:Uncharacterized protein n=1 Tax=Rhizophora mucronata TaxID=61149 RepID=A0A2P2NBN9_RHIMU